MAIIKLVENNYTKLRLLIIEHHVDADNTVIHIQTNKLPENNGKINEMGLIIFVSFDAPFFSRD